MPNYQETLMYKEICETPAILSALHDKNAIAMKALIAEFKERKIRYITGAARGTSCHALTSFKYLAEIFTPVKVTLAACSVITVYDGKTDFSGELVIGVSQSGKAADVLEVLKKANSHGATTLAITNNCDSPMAKEAKYHLFCGCGEEKSVAATKTFSAQMFLLAWLAEEIAGSGYLSGSLNNTGEKLGGVISAIENLSGGLSDKLQNIQDGFVLARGITYPVALEAALKMQETSYVKMKGYASSDFQHGPMAMVGKGTPVIFIATGAGITNKNNAEEYFLSLEQMVDKMLSFGGVPYIITDSNRFDKYDNVYKLPASGGGLIPVFEIILFIQLMSCRLACKKGNNPDAPRALSKVTITK